MNKNLVPDWKLEVYLLGELPAEEHEAIAALEASDGSVRGRIDELRAYAAEFLEKYPPELEMRKLRRMRDVRLSAYKMCDKRRGMKRVARWAVSAAACVAAAFTIATLLKVQPPTTPHTYIGNPTDSIDTYMVRDTGFLMDSITWQER